MLKEALEMEVEEYITRSKHHRDEHGHALVTRNGKAKERRITTGAGEIRIKAPRVDDKRGKGVTH